MQPRLLKTFLAVARMRNFTRAAADLHLSQSAVSDQIQTLELDLGTDLFIRAKGGLELTPAGNNLIPYAEEILCLSDEARAAVATASGTNKGLLRVGALETVAATKLSTWLVGFNQQHPDIPVNLSVAGTGELLRKLEAGELDVAFCFDRGSLDERFAARLIAVEPLVLISSVVSQVSPGKPTLAELASRRFVATEAGCVYRSIFDRAFTDVGMTPPAPSVEVGSIETIARMVETGGCTALVPRLAVTEAIGRGTVAELAWPGSKAATASLVMIWRRRRVQPPVLKMMLAAAPTAPGNARLGGDLRRRAEPSLS